MEAAHFSRVGNTCTEQHTMEMVAIKWSVTEKFRNYLMGTNVYIHIDSKNSTYWH